jgi:hypothetical protein
MLERRVIGDGSGRLPYENCTTCPLDLLSGPSFLMRDPACGSALEHHSNANAGQLPRDKSIDEVGVVQRVHPDVDARGSGVERASDLLEEVIGRDQDTQLG